MVAPIVATIATMVVAAVVVVVAAVVVVAVVVVPIVVAAVVVAVTVVAVALVVAAIGRRRATDCCARLARPLAIDCWLAHCCVDLRLANSLKTLLLWRRATRQSTQRARSSSL